MEDPVATQSNGSATVLRVKNFFASSAVVALGLWGYSLSEQNQKWLRKLFVVDTVSFSGWHYLATGAVLYTALLAVFFLTERHPGVSKSLRTWQLAGAFVRAPAAMLRQRLSREDRVAVLATLLKAFFGPLMSISLLTAIVGLLTDAQGVLRMGFSAPTFRDLFDRHLHWFLLQAIVIADVVVFTIGYLVELPRLRNQIRSVDPTLLGWAAALVCYTPFNIVLGTLLGPPGSEFPQFENSAVHFTLNVILLGLMAIYASASVALGMKASNLTHRGIVCHGPYRFVRHPAYTCKNMAWWIGSIPLVTVAFGKSTLDGLEALAAVVGWTLLYALRAITEEDHLRSVDGEYAAYEAKVRYRFVPGVI